MLFDLQILCEDEQLYLLDMLLETSLCFKILRVVFWLSN